MSRNPLVFVAALVITGPLYNISVIAQFVCVIMLMMLWKVMSEHL